jgi:glutamine synthetase
VDNRTCSLRMAGHGQGMRVENRVPGGDVNPYLAIAALVAGALHGIENELDLEPEFTGNAYGDDDAPRVPATLRDAHHLWFGSEVAAQAFGADVVGHYANMAQVELSAFDAAVTDWELRRGFERM